MHPPKKPFSEYKWRWAALTPTESLNAPPVFLGVLRAFGRYEKHPPNSPELRSALEIVQAETGTTVNLGRTRDRNLVRNSGQYWKALGLLEEAHGVITLTDFGRALAGAHITPVEFALTTVKTLELPNKRISGNTDIWDRANLRIKPLELILKVIADLATNVGRDQGYITPFELVKIVIPLAGAKKPLADYRKAISLFRTGDLTLDLWPDCTPSSNDRRMAREFLVFLNNYGFCTKSTSFGRGNVNERYYIGAISHDELSALDNIAMDRQLSETLRVIRNTQIPANIERKKILREVLERPNQSIFRREVLGAYNSTCLITGVQLDTVLEAAHIVPINQQGADVIGNGICLRVDIHRLFDANHLRILPDGNLRYSDFAAENQNYGHLPLQINIPNFVNKEHLHWRVNYY